MMSNKHCETLRKSVRILCSIKLLLTLGFVLQAVIPICIIIAVTELKNQQTVLEHTKSVSSLLGIRVRDVITNYINVVKREASQNWFYNQQHSFDPFNITQAQSLLYPSIKNTDVVSIYYSRYERNLYVGYGKYCDCGAQSIHFQYAIDGKYCTKPVDDIKTGRTDPSSCEHAIYNFTLDSEPWHIRQSRGIGMTSAIPNYIGDMRFSADPVVWISIATPITSPSNNSEVIGVAGGSYTVSEVNRFLRTLQLSPNSAIYIIDALKGYMIASSQPDEQIYQIRDGVLNMLPLSKSNDSIMGYVGSQLELKYNGNYSAVQPELFKIDSNTTIFVHPVLLDTRSILQVAFVMIAVSDYMGPTRSLEQAILIVDMVLLANAIILGIVFSMWITHPLYRLTKKLKRNVFFHGDYQFSGVTRMRKQSILYEVSTLQSNFVKMENAVNGFMKYVPREVVLNFLRHPTQQKFFQTGVEPAQVAIMFTDIEEFTAISEKLQPNILILLLTEYLETVSKIISKHGGTLDKYIGDAVMALFGCPEKLQDYAIQACSAALAIRQDTTILNVSSQAIGLPSFNTRIGIHAGACLVGNIGSSYRLSYTAIGDSVNLASRIESLNKHYGSYLMISQDVYDLVKDKMLCRQLDKVAVKGKTQGVVVHELINNLSTATQQELEFATEYNALMALYFAQNFDKALKAVAMFQQKFPFDNASRKMEERLHQLIQHPPPVSWDCCTVMHEK